MFFKLFSKIGKIAGEDFVYNLRNKTILKNEDKYYEIVANYLASTLEARVRCDEDGVVTSAWLKTSSDFDYWTIKIGKKKIEFINFDYDKLIERIYHIMDPDNSRFSRIVIEGTSTNFCVVAVKMGCYPGVTVINDYDLNSDVSFA